MREILFRGKRFNSSDWVEGNLFIPDKENTPTQICIGTNIIRITYDVIPETVGQYTGLTDKNGKKIFEGDILEFSDRLVSVFWHAHLGCWDSNFLKFTNKENDRDDMSPCRWDFRAKVIGNVYDNPELIKT